MGQVQKREREKAILEQLCEDYPDFMDGISFRPTDCDPPDFLAERGDGKRIGLELTSWVNRFQATTAKGRESKRAELQEILDCKNHSVPRNFSSAIITPRKGKLPKRD